MDIQNPQKLFNIYNACKNLHENTSDLKVINAFMSPLSELHQADDWMMIFNDFTCDELHVFHPIGIFSGDKSKLQDILPLLFQSDEISLLNETQIAEVFSGVNFSERAPQSFSSCAYSSFELNETESLILLFFRREQSNSFNQNDLVKIEHLDKFLTLFLKSSLFGSEANDYVAELTAQIRRENTWTEALGWINQTKVDETHEHSSQEFYKGVLFQLATLMHAKSAGMLDIDLKAKHVSFFSGDQDNTELKKQGALIKRLLKENVFKKQAYWHATDEEEESLKENQVTHLVLFPLYVQKDLCSILCVYKVENHFSRNDKVIGRLFADGVEKIIERRWFMSSIKRQNESLENKTKELESLVKQLEQAKEQVIQNEKLASIGQLAAGVAHEINNPVGYVSSNLNSLTDYIADLFELIENFEKLEELVDADSEQLAKIKKMKQQLDLQFIKEDLDDLLNESHEGVRRVKKIVQDLKHFSHVEEAVWQWADIHKGLESTLNIVANELKYKAEIIKDFGELPEIECMPSKLNQVYMNLLVNAGHAIEDKGKVTIRTRQLDDEFVTVEVTDTGKGISEEHLNRIFDPFFTTKAVGTGTGLGLSLSYGIIENHSGILSVESQVGVGTTFTVKLPIHQTQKQSSDAEPVGEMQAQA